MIINLACPECGGQATEYDEKKWSCLKCGNKFIYAPTQPSHTFVQSNIHIQGQATFEIDARNAKPSIPKMAKMNECNPDLFGKKISENSRGIIEINRRISSQKSKKLVALVFVFLMGGFMALATMGTLVEAFDKNSNSDVGGSIVGLVLWGVLMLWPVIAFFVYRNKIREDDLTIQKLEQTIVTLELENNTDTRVGDFVVCPHCENSLSYVPLNAPPPINGLKHCLKCGKQFFTSGLTSYPILLSK